MVYTFYSYKGGVGRSMALANIAECFREKHLRVLMVDWDLEAPGLETYFYGTSSRTNDERLDQVRRQPGLIDMLHEYKDAFPRYAEGRSAARPIFAESTKAEAANQVDLEQARK